MMLPANCCPCILSDAGFKNPWFKAVASLGWDYVGRIRNKKTSKDKDSKKHASAFIFFLGMPDN